MAHPLRCFEAFFPNSLLLVGRLCRKVENHRHRGDFPLYFEQSLLSPVVAAMGMTVRKKAPMKGSRGFLLLEPFLLLLAN